MPDTEGPVVIDPELLLHATAEEREAYQQYLMFTAIELDQWEPWLQVMVPKAANKEFAKHHKDFWEWLWGVEPGERPKPFIAIWSRGHGKSSSAEMAVLALGCRRKRNYGLYVCHEKGTPILDPDGGSWIAVEEHPTAQERFCDGYEVMLWGLPFTEVVTAEHRYWTRRITEQDVQYGNAGQARFADPRWVEAKDLDSHTWIGLPIDTSVETCPNWLTSPGLWWHIGSWWGNGAFDRGAKAQVQSKVLDEFLAAWHLDEGGYRVPPPWVEKLPAQHLTQLIDGLVHATGQVTDHETLITNVPATTLLTARRILARLGVAATIETGSSTCQDAVCVNVDREQSSCVLRFRQDTVSKSSPSGDESDFANLNVLIRDGYLWSKLCSREAVQNRVFVPIQTSTQDYITAFGRSHNCETQEQADDHITNIAGLLESDLVNIAYPELGQRLVSKFGSAKGWRRNRIRASTGFTIDAMGLDSAARGVKLENQRPDFMVFDDLDSELDSDLSTHKKIKTITRKLLPAGSQDCAVLMIQNLVHEDSIFARLVDGRADFLMDRIISGPIPAIFGMKYEERDGKFVIVGGTASWENSMSVGSCQQVMNDIGLTAFLAEFQHQTQPPEGDIFNHIAFARCTHAELPVFKRVTVWVDPAVTTTDRSDSMGIQCDALGTNGRFYRLYSWETRATPLTAIEKALKVALRWGADTVGVETDQGGDTWEVVYHQACENMRKEGLLDGSAPRFKHAKASTGHGSKIARAERMLVDYERGKFVHLEGTHHVLEQALKRFPRVKPYDLVDACLIGETPVATPDGWVHLQNISRGDPIWTRQGLDRVADVGVTQRHAQTWVLATANGMSIEGTWHHPVWTEECAWMPLAMTQGLHVRTTGPQAATGHPQPGNGKMLDTVASLVLTVQPVSQRKDVWNLEVAGEHEYLAGGVAVHNSYWSWADLNDTLIKRRIRVRSSARDSLGNVTINLR